MSNLWNKIKLIWKGREIATNLIDIKSKWKSWTFWASLIGNALSLIGALKGIIPPQAAMIINAVLGAVYNYVRGLAKSETDGVKPYATTSEFLIGLASMANNAVIDVQTGGVHTPTLAITSIVLTHAIAAAGQLANMRPSESSSAGVEPGK